MHVSLTICPVFQGLSVQEISVLISSITYQLKSFAKGDLIASNNEECDRLIILLEGTVKGEMMDVAGKTMKIEDMSAGKPLASAFLFGARNKFPVDVIATSEVQVMIIPRQQFIVLMQKSERILSNYLFMVSSKAQFLSEKLRFHTFNTIKGKIAQFLLSNLKEGDKKLVLQQTQQEISDLFGIARPSLGRSLAELESEGLIKIDRREIEIINKQALRDLIQL